MADVFVSYARSDRARIEPLVAAIAARGWSVWWDPEIQAGEHFDDQIEAELKAAKAVIVVWTRTSVASRWVRGEAREAADRGTLVPARFDDATLPMDVRAIHTTDLDGWGEDQRSPQFQALLRALSAMIARHGGTAPGGAADQSASSASTPTGAPRLAICVLPFANMSGDVEQEYFSDGISEDIITDLSKVSTLAVASRNSAFMYKGTRVDVPKVARELKVSHVLEGSVRKAGGRVRITAQLVDGATNDSIWAERYDRELTDIFTLQDEISQAIVKALKLKLAPEERKAIAQRGTTVLDAYNLYLMARHHYMSGMLSDTRKNDTVIRLCRSAIDLDPNYARAYALMATAQRYRLGITGVGENGDAAATRALELDGNLAEAHAAKAGVLTGVGDYDAADREIAIALRLDPESADVLREASRVAFHQGRYEEAIAHWERLFALVETDFASGGLLIMGYTKLGDHANVVRVARLTLARAEQAFSVDPDNGSAMAALFSCLLYLGEPDRARDWARRAVLIDPDNMIMRYNLACDLMIQLQDVDMALEMLGPYLARTGREQLEWTRKDPDLDGLRHDPRFIAMMEAAERRLSGGVLGESAP
jgi:adenylate cyclase